jgi:hypothetical protein
VKYGRPQSAIVSVWEGKDGNSLLRQDKHGPIFDGADESGVGEMYGGIGPW